MEQTYVTHLHIEASPSEVMTFLLEPENWLRFAAGVIDCAPRGETLSLGTKGSWTRRQGPGKVVNEFEVIELDHGGTLVLRVEAPGVRTVDRTELRASDGGTDATFTETMTIDGVLMRAMMTVMRPLVRRNLDRTYLSLKREVEGDSGARSAGA